MKKRLSALLLCAVMSCGVFCSAQPVSAGWNACWRYEENGAAVRSCWKKISGSWYYFDGDGIMAAGWIKTGGSWYYCGRDGRMQTGWLTLDSGTYYLQPSGAIAENCTLTIDGESCRFSASGRLIKGDADAWYMTLVNPTHPIPDNFTVETVDVHGKPFDVRAADALNRLFADAKAAGYPLLMVSGYRTVPYQENLFRRSVQQRINRGMSRAAAEAETALYVAKAGYSEHNLGLAADIVSSDWYSKNSGLESWFDQTPHYQWLSENAWKYGFILRYPKDKTDITGIGYEPWHYRYVGVEAAKIIYDEGLTFEEYWEKYLT
ncbi:MAG: D-alanyl-D-alanine carboxypeptidase family protein, partial [Oscillospiraceae bacterium]|nr:D-alanyl-D-alanine carboxypeptidase family protein [Oscillospiraceae bacterium]